ncbi:MAG: hypothetical protein J6589_07705 [Snodgrassella sp.]|uniref:hypothetical protein n=1 Tax=Snodgrassella sp. TaxID=2815304 RepID=UPI00258767F1|nr:hypothetical protein [Snodgrassella sp.]MCO6514336.1 hypothetical protein [Snodgrassella sp.]
MKPKIHLHELKNHPYGNRICWQHRPTGALVVRYGILLYDVIIPTQSPLRNTEKHYGVGHLRNARTIIRRHWLECISKRNTPQQKTKDLIATISNGHFIYWIAQSN